MVIESSFLRKKIVYLYYNIGDALLIHSKLRKDITSLIEPVIISYGDHNPSLGLYSLNEQRINAEKVSFPVEPHLMDVLNEKKDKIIRMLARQQLEACSLSYDELEVHYYNMISYWRYFLDVNKIDIVISRAVPHFASEYIFCLLVTSLGIKVLVENHLPYLNRVLIGDYYDDSIHFLLSEEAPSKKICDNVESIINGIRCNETSKTSYYPQDAMQKTAFGMSAFDLWWRVNIALLREVKRKVFRGDSRYLTRYYLTSGRTAGFLSSVTPIQIIKKSIISFKRSRINRSLYAKLVEEKGDDGAGYPRVLYAAHYEPEASVNPMGGKFYTNFEALKYLEGVLPDSAVLIYKEHPVNLMNNSVGVEPEAGRNPVYYELIKNIKNIRFISAESENKAAIRSADIVVTITGTMGLEASIMEKPVVVFGSPWYSSCNNIISYNTINNLNAFFDSEWKDVRTSMGMWQEYLEIMATNGIEPKFAWATITTTKREISDQYVALIKRYMN